MVNNHQHSLDFTFLALSHPIRRHILERLTRGEASVAELTAPHNVSKPAITKHLRVLERAGLLARNIDGRVHRCRAGSSLNQAQRWIDRYQEFWEKRFEAMDRYLKKNR